MVDEDLKEYAKQVASKAANAPNDTSNFEFQRGLVLLVGESRSTNVDDGAKLAIALLLLEGGSEAGCASVAVEARRSRLVSNRIPVGEDKDLRSGEFGEKCAYCVFHGGGKIKRGSFFEERRDWAYTASHIGQKLAVVTKAAK